MLHEMYDEIKYVLSMFMIYECNVCACKLISCLAEENKSLTAVGDLKSLIVEDERSFGHCWG